MAVKLILADLRNDFLFSSVSIWEFALKKEKGKLNTAISAYDFQAELLSLQFMELPLLGVHSNPLGSLPKLHNDPFDRILIAQAMVEGLVLMTADKVVARYPRAIYKV